MLELADLGIGAGADGDHAAARDAWRNALAYAEQHLPGDSIIPWIQSSLGDALLTCGDDQGALEMAYPALAFCASVRAPLAALTMAKAYLRLGNVAHARYYADQARMLRGETVMQQFSAADRETLEQG